jgi:hypothetical protein
MGMKPVITDLVQDIGEDEQAAGKTYGQSKQINERDEFIFHQVAEGNLQVITNHN